MKDVQRVKRISLTEIAEYFMVDRRTIHNYKLKFENRKNRNLDMRKAKDTIEFIIWYDYNR